jgi:hypothetical protein
MPAFSSWQSYWRFAAATRNHSRYIFDQETRQFLRIVLKTAETRRIHLPVGHVLWRSQLGSEWNDNVSDDGEVLGEEERPFQSSRMKPLPREATEGRINPKGIPCLYLSDRPETALAEARPWIGASLSLGQFVTVRELVVVNCGGGTSKDIFYLNGEPSPQKREAAVWRHINKAFSQPVTPNDRTADYVPTQILAELFKMNGYDGVIFQSSVAEGLGLNYALFDLDTARMTRCGLYTTDSIYHNFRESGNPYFIRPTVEARGPEPA